MNVTRKTSRRRRRTGAIITALLGVFLALALAGCNPPNSNNTEHTEANAGINQILANQPVPIFPSSQQRADLIEAEAIMALGSSTTTFFFPQGATVTNGKADAPPFKTCPSEGEPIPNTSSLTNPQQQTSGGDAVVGQMDPDGVYTPAASDGTFVLCDTSAGRQDLEYWEGPVETESGTAVWDASAGQIRDVGTAMLPVCTIVQARDGDGTKLQAGTRYYQCVKAKGDTSRGTKLSKADFRLSS
jgi:hypothetical protein